MSYGPFHESPRLILGNAINQAANCYDKTEWIGISWSPDLQMRKSNRQPISYYPLVEYMIPYKEGKNFGLALNWVYNRDSMSCAQIIESLLRNKKRENDLVKAKYENTLKFFNYIKSLK